MQSTDTDQAFDEIAEALKSYIRECALLLLGAMGEDGTFPTDPSGVTTLIERAAEPEQGLRDRRFAAESPDDPRRPSAPGVVRVSPARERSLRLRTDCGPFASISVILNPDGQLGEFTELTDSAVTDSAVAAETEAPCEDDKERFGSEHLVGVLSAPRNDLVGISVTWIALYDKGLILHYLVPSPGQEGEGPIELRDDLGTKYAPIGIGDVDLGMPPLRSLEFAPGVPASASRLIVVVHGEEVEVPVVR